MYDTPRCLRIARMLRLLKFTGSCPVTMILYFPYRNKKPQREGLEYLHSHFLARNGQDLRLDSFKSCPKRRPCSSFTGSFSSSFSSSLQLLAFLPCKRNWNPTRAPKGTHRQGRDHDGAPSLAPTMFSGFSMVWTKVFFISLGQLLLNEGSDLWDRSGPVLISSLYLRSHKWNTWWRHRPKGVPTQIDWATYWLVCYSFWAQKKTIWCPSLPCPSTHSK